MRSSALLCLASSLSIGFAYVPKESPGCHPLWTQTTEHIPSQTLKIGTSKNGVREYIFDLPSNWKPEQPMPLVIAFHGKNNQNYVFREQTQLSDPKWNNEAAVAFPKAIDLQWTGDPTSPPLAEINDIEFAGQLIDHITQMYCVDLRRVYAVGFSNGGGLTQLLACDRTLSSRLAAAAIVSGAFYLDYALKDPLFSHCTPARSPFPIMEFHGNEDPIIHYNGKATPDGQTFDIANWGPAWAQRNGCSADQVAVPLVTQQSQFAVYSWNCGSAKDSVSHHQIEGLGHAWPSRRKQNDDSLGLGATTFDATPAIIDFFRGHTLPDITKAFKDEL